MLRRLAAVGVFLLTALPVPLAHAGTLGLAEVRAPDGALLAQAGEGPFAYPADGEPTRGPAKE